MNSLTLNNNSQIATVHGVEELYNRWITFIEGSERTIDSYTKDVRRFLEYLSANGINEPTRDDIKAYRDYLTANYKPTTVQAYLMAIKQFFKWTALEGVYPNITEHIKGAKLDAEHKKDYLTPTQVSRVLSLIDRTTLTGKRDYAIVSLMVTTGLRTIEVARASVEDLRPVADYTALFIQGKGKGDKTAYVKVVPTVEDAIRDYLEARKAIGESAKGSDALFSSTANRNRGRSLTTRSISSVVKNAFLQAGYDSDRLTAHSLRHTTATLNLLAGGSVEETQQLLRHSNINTTLIYVHALERAKNNSEQRVADVIFN